MKQASTQTVCLLNNMLCKQYLHRMPALRQFYNREREISRIRSALDRDRHQFIVVYGRRRCGKSTLLTEKILGPNDVYLLAPEANQEIQRAALVQAFSPKFPELELASFSDWVKFFDYLKLATKDPFTLVLDEFPNLVKVAPELPSILNRYVDQRENLRFNLIVCGSSQQMMRGLVLNSTAPLYGRADEIVKVEQLQAGWLAEHLRGASAADVVTEYAIWGGVPRYWELRSRFSSLSEAVQQLILAPTGTLREEPNRLLLDELTDVTQSLSLLNVVANGANRLTAVGARMQRPASDLSRPLRRLIEMGYVKKEIPYGASPLKNRQTLYRTGDHFIRFYYDLCFTWLARLVPGAEATAWAAIEERLSQFVGQAWEELSRHAVVFHPELKGRFLLPQRWWGTGSNRKPLEVDFVTESIDGNSLLIGECKWSDISSAETLHRALVEKAKQLPFYKSQQIITVVAARSIKEPAGGITMEPEQVLELLKG